MSAIIFGVATPGKEEHISRTPFKKRTLWKGVLKEVSARQNMFPSACIQLQYVSQVRHKYCLIIILFVQLHAGRLALKRTASEFLPKYLLIYASTRNHEGNVFLLFLESNFFCERGRLASMLPPTSKKINCAMCSHLHCLMANTFSLPEPPYNTPIFNLENT